MLKRLCIMTFLCAASSAYAQDDSSQEMLEILRSLNGKVETLIENQEALSADVDVLKTYHTPTTTSPSVASSAEQTTDQVTATAETPTIKRRSGWIASVHPYTHRDYSIGVQIGKMVIGGFPMKHAVFREKFNVNSDVQYKGKGELKIEEGGLHTFNVLIDGESGHPICSFTMKIQGRDVVSVSGTGQIKGVRAWGGEIDLKEPGFYTWEMEQFCRNGDLERITWDVQILTPNAIDGVSLSGDYIFHRSPK